VGCGGEPVGGGRAVEAGQGMEVDHAPELVLGDLRVLQGRRLGQPGRRNAEGFGDQAPQADGEPFPQLRCPPLPHHLRGIVAAQRLPQHRVALPMPLVAGPRPAMDAPSRAVCAGTAAAAVVAATVHGPERRRGQRREHQRVLRHRRRHGLPTRDAGADQLEHVRGVQTRTRRALGGPAAAAADVGDPQRLLFAAVGRDDLAGAGVDGLRAAAQPDRTRTVPDPRQRLGPGIEVRGGHQIHDVPLHLPRQRRQVQGRLCPEGREGVREQAGQGVVDNRTSPRAHRLHHPKGCATRLSAIPPRDTPGSGGSRSLVKKLQSRHRDRCNAETPRTKGVRTKKCLCVLRLSVCTASGQGGEPTPGGNAPSGFCV
jgi:hypothetical protein